MRIGPESSSIRPIQGLGRSGDLSRLETSLALASRLGDARCRRLDLPSARLADWDQDAPATGMRGRDAEPLGEGPALWQAPRARAARPPPAAIRRRAGSGDGARRPRERRESGRGKAAGLLVGWGCCSATLDADANHCTSRQSDTHRIESREVRYPWLCLLLTPSTLSTLTFDRSDR